MLRTVHLHGDLKDIFGGPYRFNVASPREAGRALKSQVKGFGLYVSMPRQDGTVPHYEVVVGPLERGDARGADELDLRLGKAEELHILPVIAGAGRGKSIAKIVLGVALVAGAVFTGGGSLGAYAIGSSSSLIGITYGQIALTGVMMVLRGASGLLSRPPDSNYRQREVEGNPSFLFNGAVNVSAEGNCMPVVIGEVITGSLVLSAGLDTVDVN